MSDGGGADAALGADHRDDAADRFGVGRGEQAADRAHHVDGADRRNHVVADAAPNQLAIERDVVGPSDHNDASAGVAIFGKRIEAGQDAVAATVRFQHDDIGRWRTAVGFDRGCDAAHLYFDMRLAETPVFAGRLNRGRGLDGLAERLDGHARRRRDVLVAGECLRRRRFRRGGLQRSSDHLPTSLIAPLEVSG